jgi:hypothetical protein
LLFLRNWFFFFLFHLFFCLRVSDTSLLLFLSFSAQKKDFILFPKHSLKQMYSYFGIYFCCSLVNIFLVLFNLFICTRIFVYFSEIICFWLSVNSNFIFSPMHSIIVVIYFVAIATLILFL